jgi:phosphoserine aminotransferase
MPTSTRLFNFSAGPAVLPIEVLEEAQRDLLALPGVGMSILEISHRSAAFDEVIDGCEADLRQLAGVPSNYKVLFLQGGASLQFSMVPARRLGRLHRHRFVGREGGQGSEAGRHCEDRGVDGVRELRPRAEAVGAHARP